MIEVLNLQTRYRLNRKAFEKLLAFLVEKHELRDPEVSLAFVDTKAIKKLNRQFLKKNAPTDVLSFPLGKCGSDGKYYLGDIVISVPQAFKQCFAQAHGLEREMEFLTVHGFLHLLGFDHGKGIEQEEEKIRRLLSWG